MVLGLADREEGLFPVPTVVVEVGVPLDLQDFLDRQDTEGPFGVGAVPGHVLVTEDALTQKQPGFLVEFPGDREELFVVRLVGLDLLLESFGELRGLLLGVVAVLAQDPVGGTDVDVDVTQGVVRPGLGLDLGDDLGRVPVEVVRGGRRCGREHTDRDRGRTGEGGDAPGETTASKNGHNGNSSPDSQR